MTPISCFVRLEHQYRNYTYSNTNTESLLSQFLGRSWSNINHQIDLNVYGVECAKSPLEKKRGNTQQQSTHINTAHKSCAFTFVDSLASGL